MLKQLAAWRGWTAAARRLRTAPVVVLAYHDLREDDDLPTWLRVSRSDFRRQLDLWQRLGRVLHPDDLHDPARWPRDRLSFVLTFDDGQLNNRRLAWPLLQERGLGALFFVSTWHAQTGEPLWFDQIVTPIQELRLAELDLRGHGLARYSFTAGDAARRWEDIQQLLVDLKTLGSATDPRLTAVLAECRGLLPDEKATLARFRPLDEADIAAMHAEGAAFGSHGHRHRILTNLDQEELHEELALSRSFLERVTGTEIDTIAYPNGDSDARVERACRECGYKLGYATGTALCGPQTNVMRIPRLMVGGFDSEAVLRYRINRALWRGAGAAAPGGRREARTDE
jgi:peptidoglycan/xylan/chitin deacetylase (PgdA/CDA1 family)